MVQIIPLGFTGDKTHEFTNILQKTIPLSSIHTEKGDVSSFNYFRTHKVLDNNIGVLITLVSLVQRKMLKKIYAILFLVVWQLSSTLLILLIYYKNLQEWTHFVGALSGNFFVCEGGIMWVSLGIILYCIKNTQIKLFSGYSIFCLFCSLCSLTAPLARAMYFLEFFTNIDQTVIWQILEIIYVLILGNAWYFTPVVPHGLYFGDYQWMMIAALPFMMLYNRKRGCKIKTFFYLFYPIHILIFLLISRFLIILQ